MYLFVYWDGGSSILMNFFDNFKNKISKEWKTGHLIYHFDIANYGERKKYTIKDEQINEK